MTNYWSPIINATLPFTANLNSAISDGLKNKSDVENAVKMFKQLVGATAQANENVFGIFAKEIEFA
jgi:hypothetical protein